MLAKFQGIVQQANVCWRSFKESYMNSKKIVSVVSLFVCGVAGMFAQEAAPAAATAVAGGSSAVKYVAAALAVGIACIGGGMAVGRIGAAAMGAMSENAELSGKALPFVGLAEGICLWGFLVALLIILF
jgi:V/A-type H+-transporting ATPase subunit K